MATEILRSQEKAEDVVHDAFMQFMKASNEKELIDPKPYLFKIARNLAIKRTKDANKEFEKTSEFVRTIDHAINPDQPEINFERIQNLLDGLPPSRRRVFELVKMEGLTEKAAASKLSLSPHTIRTQVRRALEYLRKNSSSLYT